MTKVETLLKEAMELSDHDREYLAYELHASLSWSDEENKAFAEELKRRVAGIDSGELELLDEDEADRLMFGEPDDE